MTGWEQDKNDSRIGTQPAVWTMPPTEATLAEIAVRGQRQQLEQLVTALEAHPDLAARVWLALRSSP